MRVLRFSAYAVGAGALLFAVITVGVASTGDRATVALPSHASTAPAGQTPAAG